MLIYTLRLVHAMASPAVQRRCFRSRPSTKEPLIVILGATGTGKSDLAIQMARNLSQRASSNIGEDLIPGAEIINADAMQLYRGLPIVTNKVTLAEQQGIPHHLLDHIAIEEEPWTVQEYVQQADRVIKDIRSRMRIPIVVGGTGYYVYGLLFRDALMDKEKNKDARSDYEGSMAEPGNEKDAAEAWPILNADTSEMYAKLQEVDPEQAQRWHPNDRRKIQRSLEICLRSGRKASDIYREQKQHSTKSIGVENELEQEREDLDYENDDMLRYEPLIFWLEAEDVALKTRLNQRVDTMVHNGLLDEAQDMGKRLLSMQANDMFVDTSKGVWVSIGYKEMEPWVKACQSDNTQAKELEKLKATCIEAVKAGTRQYAKRQNRFIRRRLANALSNAKASKRLFLLDCTIRAQWHNEVQRPAMKVTESYLQGDELPNPSDMSELARTTLNNMVDEEVPERIARRCEVCNKVLMNDKEWNKHVNSRSHKRTLQSIRKHQLNQVERADGHSPPPS